MPAADLSSYYNSPDLLEAQKAATQSSQNLVEYQSAASLLPEKLRNAIQEKLDYNKDLIEQTNKAQSEYISTPATARAKYADPSSQNYIFNPMQAEALVAQEKSGAYQNFANLSDLLAERRGTISDLVTAGTNAFNSAVLAQQGKAELAKGNFQTAFQLAQAKVDADYKERSLQLEEAKANPSGISSVLANILAGGGEVSTQPTESEPQYTPTQDGASSPRGEWVFKNGKWESTKDLAGKQEEPISEEDKVRKQLGLLALSQANTPAEYKTAYDLLFPADKPESAIIQKRKVALTSATSTIKQVAQIVKDMGDLSGQASWWGGLTGNLPGVEGGKGEELARTTDGLAKAIASVFAAEVGVATNTDIARWKGLMPRTTDTPAERITTLKTLRSRIEEESDAMGISLPPEFYQAFPPEALMD